MLYEQDLFAWTQQQVNLLTHQRWHELDVENLIDELEGMATRDQREMLGPVIK